MAVKARMLAGPWYGVHALPFTRGRSCGNYFQAYIGRIQLERKRMHSKRVTRGLTDSRQKA